MDHEECADEPRGSPAALANATEKYAGTGAVIDDSAAAVGYVAGEPFPIMTPNDPETRYKICGISCLPAYHQRGIDSSLL